MSQSGSAFLIAPRRPRLLTSLPTISLQLFVDVCVEVVVQYKDSEIDIVNKLGDYGNGDDEKSASSGYACERAE